MCLEQLPSGMFRKQTCLILDTFVHSRTLPSNFEHLRQISDGTTRFLIFMSISGRDRQILNICVNFRAVVPEFGHSSLFQLRQYCSNSDAYDHFRTEVFSFALLPSYCETIASTYFKLLNAWKKLG